MPANFCIPFPQRPGPAPPSGSGCSRDWYFSPSVAVPLRRRAGAEPAAGEPSRRPLTPWAPSPLRGHQPSAELPPRPGRSHAPATLRHLRPAAAQRSRKKDASLTPRPPPSPAPLPPPIGWRGCHSLGAARPLARRVLPFWPTARPRSGLTMGDESPTGSGLVPWNSSPVIRGLPPCAQSLARSSVSQGCSRTGLDLHDQPAARFRLVGSLATPSPNSTPVLDPQLVKGQRGSGLRRGLRGFPAQHHFLLKPLQQSLASTIALRFPLPRSPVLSLWLNPGITPQPLSLFHLTPQNIFDLLTVSSLFSIMRASPGFPPSRSSFLFLIFLKCFYSGFLESRGMGRH